MAKLTAKNIIRARKKFKGNLEYSQLSLLRERNYRLREIAQKFRDMVSQITDDVYVWDLKAQKLIEKSKWVEDGSIELRPLLIPLKKEPIMPTHIPSHRKKKKPKK